MKLLKRPPSILEINNVICIGQSYEAYVYKYTNILNGKWYVGWHLGLFDGTYWHSSKNQEFLKVFGGSQSILKLEILHIGLTIDMKNTESRILTDQKAKSNPLSYNNAGSPTGNKEPIDIEKCQEVLDIIEQKIADGEYTEEDLNLIASLRSLQVREGAEDKQHVSRIKEGILENGLTFQKPVLIWEEQDNGDDLRGDGNHTVIALNGLNNFNTIKTLRMPKEFIEKYQLTDVEFRYIGNLLNPRDQVVKLETVDDDAIKILLGLLEQGTEIDPKKTQYGKDVCKGLGFKGKKPAALVTKAIKIHKESVLAKSGVKKAYYDKNHKDNLNALNRKADSYRNDKSIVVIGCTTYVSKIIRAILEAVTDLKCYADRPHIHLVCYHNGNDKSKNEWETKEKSSLTNIIKTTFAMMAPVVIEDENGMKYEVPRTFTIHEMDHYQSDIS